MLENLDTPIAPIDCQTVEDQHLADRYVLGQLLPEEAEAFEDHYMTCATCVAAVEHAELLVGGIKQVAAESLVHNTVGHGGLTDSTPTDDTLADGATDTEGPAPVIPIDSYRQRTETPPSPQTSAAEAPTPRGSVSRRYGSLVAAALVGAVLTTPLWLDRSGMGTPAAVAVYHLQPERSVDAAPSHRIAQPSGAVDTVIALELTPPTYDTYRITIERKDPNPWSADGLRLGERDTVHVRVPREILTPGDHTLILEGRVDGGWVDAGQFTFRVE